MSYGIDYPDQFRRGAYFVDRILKGAKAADLPVELPTKYKFVMNLIAAKQIGLTISPLVLAIADKVIRCCCSSARDNCLKCHVRRGPHRSSCDGSC